MSIKGNMKGKTEMEREGVGIRQLGKRRGMGRGGDLAPSREVPLQGFLPMLTHQPLGGLGEGGTFKSL